MKPLLITTLLAVSAPVASANDIVDFHKKIFRAHKKVHRAIVTTHRKVHRTVHRKIFHPRNRVQRRVHTRRVWIPVRYEIVRRKVYIPGTTRRVWHPARYEVRYDDCGNSYRVLVRRGHWDTVRTAGRYEMRRERVRRGGYYETVQAGRRHGDRDHDTDRNRRHRR